MCGIAGIFNLKSSLAPGLVSAMSKTLRHRGPDDKGYLSWDTRISSQRPRFISNINEEAGEGTVPKAEEANLFFGHRRLSIIDLSSAGRQPMKLGDSPDDSLWIVYNGEVYNYKEIREELRGQGHTFRTATDTEVVLTAYKHWGVDCVKHFNGDWAFCVLNAAEKTLFLSRDRYGIKPLYYFNKNKTFAFASEIKALLVLPEVSRELNQKRAFDFYVFSLIDHKQETLFRDIQQLGPGESAEFDLKTGQMKTWQHYDLPHPSEDQKFDEKFARRAIENVRDLLFDSVRLRLRADVPVGTSLSGGLDSSAVVAVMAQLLKLKDSSELQHTFTASYPDMAIDETVYAEHVARHCGTIPHYVKPTAETLSKDLSRQLYFHDEPFAGTGVYTQWEVFKKAAEQVKVTLDGQGADEVFAGYSFYRAAFLASLARHLMIPRFLEELIGFFRHAGYQSPINLETKMLALFLMPGFFRKLIVKTLYHGKKADFSKYGGTDEADLDELMHLMWRPDVKALLYSNMAKVSLPHLLKNGDRSSMAHSIEARMPFTDYRLVDYVFSLPTVYKIRKGWTKWILRMAVQDLLPEEIVWRKDKLGFATPPWVTRSDIYDLWHDQNFEPSANNESGARL